VNNTTPNNWFGGIHSSVVHGRVVMFYATTYLHAEDTLVLVGVIYEASLGV
jgi:hypothetical protein